MDEFTLTLILVSHFLVAAVAFIAGMGYGQSKDTDNQFQRRPSNIDHDDPATLWKIIGEHITNGTLESDEAQKILEIVGAKGWFGKLASRKQARPQL